MKNITNIAIIAVTAFTMQACSSSRSASTTSSSVNTGDSARISTESGGGTARPTDGTTATGGTPTGSNSGTSSNISPLPSMGTANSTSSGISGSDDTATGSTSASVGDESSGKNKRDDVQRFIQQAAISGMSEVQLSQVALKNAQSSAVKNFADMMVRDHGKANAALKVLAAAKGISLPDSSFLSASAAMVSSAGKTSATGNTTSGTASSGGASTEFRDQLERLTAAKGKAFDQAYIQIMMQDHLKAVSLFQQGAKSPDPAVKAFAAKTLPVLKTHLQQVTSLSQQP
jgi:putative membrane protein